MDKLSRYHNIYLLYFKHNIRITKSICIYTNIYKCKGKCKKYIWCSWTKWNWKNDGAVFENLKYDIEFKDVSFAYKDEYILKDINFEIKENEYVAFVGHTGSGKSTIMNLLVKFYKNQKGEILIGNTNINYINSKCIRDNIAIVLQDAFLFQDTIANNVCSDRKKAKKCLEMVGASYIIKQRGLDYEILANGTNFSSGEKQLISFARALAKNPKILILLMRLQLA